MTILSATIVANVLFVASRKLSATNHDFIARQHSVMGGLTIRGGSIHDPIGDDHPGSLPSQKDTYDPSDNPRENYSPNVFQKSETEESFIRGALEANFLFQDIISAEQDCTESLDLSQVIASFEKHKLNKQDILCRQGDKTDTDYLYIVAKGTCSVSIDEEMLPDPYGTMGPGSLIGDLAMLCGNPRAATVQAETSVTVFRLHRSDFDYFLNYSSGDSSEEESTNSVLSKKEEIRKEVSEIDYIIDQISGVKSKYHGKIIEPFQPDRRWLWGRWNGTIIQHGWKSATINMALSLLFIVAFTMTSERFFNAPITWPFAGIPDPNHPMILRLKGLHKLWAYTMSITTLMLTFFLNQAYGLWRDIYVKGRQIQGRLNDLAMILACAAERDPRTGEYTDRAQILLDDIAMSSRLCHAFSWAGFVERFNALLTPRGLSRMLSRGVMTRSQYDILVDTPPTVCAPQHTTLMWILAQIYQGMRDGIIKNDLSYVYVSKLCDLRGTFGGVGDSLDGKIPLAYAHFVQVMIDVFLVMAPFALYCELGSWSVLAVGVLNVFYSGMNDLAKVFLFPLGNIDQAAYNDSSVNMDLGVLIRESNAGSKRWKGGLQKLPFTYRP